MARRSQEVPDEALVELLIRVEGSTELNRLTTFRLPLVGRTEGNEDTPGQVQFESRVLIHRIKEALNRLL